ncbi:uncharacterized protein [Rutidosis leptorrhynchoides]|uniref:uncharacterized protein n=1 Tax=Rutidosis leptorrhynchoides TaxID=125765 RepID=UPI003A99F474
MIIMGSNETDAYLQLVNQLKSYSNIPENLTSSLGNYNSSINVLSQQDRFSKPMPWIGLYVATASMLCILAMVADLIHGVRNGKLWFPNKYFTLNAASLTVIAVAMKLPVDLSSIMPGVVDQNVKLISLVFMSTMMANLLPSLATMDNKSLVSNMIGLGILVITVVVNVCIQIGTRLLRIDQRSIVGFIKNPLKANKTGIDIIIFAYGYVGTLLLLLMIQTCSALAIVTFKLILEWKYKKVHESILNLIDQQQGTLDVQKLKQHVGKYWTIAETGSPQFMAACLPTSSASGMGVVITCKILACWSAILVVCVSHVLRCLNWKNEPRMNENEDLRDYVLQLHDDTELAEITLKRIDQSLKHFIQKVEKKRPNYLTKLIMESRGFQGVGKYDNNHHHIPSLLTTTTTEEHPSSWSLPLVTLTAIAVSLPNIQKETVDRLLRGVSEGLAYVALVEECLNNASDDHANIQNYMVERLLRGVNEGLAYVVLNSKDDNNRNIKDIKKAARSLWLEVVNGHKWLGYKLQKLAPKRDSTSQILQRFKDTAKKEVETTTDICKSISAKSMYRISETILSSYNNGRDNTSHEELFKQLSSMISDILAACLTNLPQVIVMKCHTSEIEKREASVRAAAQLLYETTEIITILQGRALPESLDQDDLPFIDKWRASLNHIP